MKTNWISIWKEIWELTFQNDPELYSSRRSHHVWWVLHVAEEGTIVAELSWIQLYRHVPLVYVSNKLHPIFELVWSREFFPIIKVENLQQQKKQGGKKKSDLTVNTLNALVNTIHHLTDKAETNKKPGLHCVCGNIIKSIAPF